MSDKLPFRGLIITVLAVAAWLVVITAAYFMSFVIVGFVQDVSAHDIYTPLHSRTGQLCCGGDPITGDCEPVDRFDRLANGDARMWSERYKAWIAVRSPKIQEMAIPEADGVMAHEAHFCGVPRSKVVLAPFQPDNDDPNFWVYCAFVAPGGV